VGARYCSGRGGRRGIYTEIPHAVALANSLCKHFPQAVDLSNRLCYLCINTPSSSPTRIVSRTHLPLGAILEFQISQNTRGEVLIFISRKEVAKRG